MKIHTKRATSGTVGSESTRLNFYSTLEFSNVCTIVLRTLSRTDVHAKYIDPGREPVNLLNICEVIYKLSSLRQVCNANCKTFLFIYIVSISHPAYVILIKKIAPIFGRHYG
jgi:hypothetical protein